MHVICPFTGTVLEKPKYPVIAIVSTGPTTVYSLCQSQREREGEEPGEGEGDIPEREKEDH